MVAESDAELLGFAHALPKRVPPVYDPGTRAALVDDFCVAQPALYDTVGAALLDALGAILREDGRGLLIVSSACGDEPKAALLRRYGLTATSQWWSGQA